MPVDPDELARAAAQAAENMRRDAERRRRREERKQQMRDGSSSSSSSSSRSSNHGSTSNQHNQHSQTTQSPQTGHAWLVFKTCFTVFMCLLYPLRLGGSILRRVMGNKYILIMTTIVVCIWVAALLVEGVFVWVVDLFVTLQLGWFLAAVGIQIPADQTAQTTNNPDTIAYSATQGHKDLAVKDSSVLGQVHDMSSNIQYLSQIEVYSKAMSPVARFVSNSFGKFLSSKRKEQGSSGATVVTVDNLGEEWNLFWSGVDAQINDLLEQSNLYTKHVVKNQVSQYRHARLLLQRIQATSVVSKSRDDAFSWTSARSWPGLAPRYLLAQLKRSWKLVTGGMPTEQQALAEHVRALMRLNQKSKDSYAYLASVFSNDARDQMTLDSTLCEIEGVFREAVHACDWTTTNHLQLDGGIGGIGSRRSVPDARREEAKAAYADMDSTTYDGNARAAMYLTGYQSAGAVLCVGAKDTVESVAMRAEAARIWERALDGLAEDVGLLLERLEGQPLNNAEMEGIEQELVHHVNNYMKGLERFAS
ncbi:hypothetical protein CTA2_5319 [Colletotrichum tanaceti]|uniref:Uncharacterized protein n=1 Tax=Colletotrichum tanaceti TaxID=1306861 RepID=A0A4U6XIE5_9PEZI|nr:hypothetical protein CTA2_5319 [Colletotrichum tanaceti]TKW55303.1 hypothetical protein CTA1_951 [Colletotrichum tanaceti]